LTNGIENAYLTIFSANDIAKEANATILFWVRPIENNTI
jgi:hypothetical protein